MAKNKGINLVMTVKATIENRDVFDYDTIVKDLTGELVKVKTGAYENLLYGAITKVEIVK